MSARPYQVGDRVRVVTSDDDFTGTVSEFQRLTADGPLNMWIRRDEPKLAIIDGEVETITLGHVWVTDDRTKLDWLNLSGTTVELLEAAAIGDVDDRAELAAELELLSGEHRALLGPVDRTGATDKAELDRFMARSKNLDTRVEQLRTAHFPEAATLGWQAGTWFTCDQHGENHRTVWTEQDGLVDDVDDGPGTALMLRPFQASDKVGIDGELGVIVELRDETPSGAPGVYALAIMNGFPFPAWDAVRLTPDRTRPADGRTLEWIDVPERSRFAPPADAEPYDDGRIPDVESWDLPCLESKNTLHAWDEDGMCLLCGDDKQRPPAQSRFSQAGLMSVVGAR